MNSVFLSDEIPLSTERLGPGPELGEIEIFSRLHLALLLISATTSPPKISCPLCWSPSCVIEAAHACLQKLWLEGLKST